MSVHRTLPKPLCFRCLGRNREADAICLFTISQMSGARCQVSDGKWKSANAKGQASGAMPQGWRPTHQTAGAGSRVANRRKPGANRQVSDGR